MFCCNEPIHTQEHFPVLWPLRHVHAIIYLPLSLFTWLWQLLWISHTFNFIKAVVCIPRFHKAFISHPLHLDIGSTRWRPWKLVFTPVSLTCYVCVTYFALRFLEIMTNVTIWYSAVVLYFKVSWVIYFEVLSVLQSVGSTVGWFVNDKLGGARKQAFVI
jgi:hypothetical protein